MRRLKVYHAAVDMTTRAMTALEDQLATLTRDHQAQTDLLNEASTNVDSLRGEVELLSAQIETLEDNGDYAQRVLYARWMTAKGKRFN